MNFILMLGSASTRVSVCMFFFFLVSVHKCNDFVSFLLTSLFNGDSAISSKNRFCWILISVEKSFALFPSLDVFDGAAPAAGWETLDRSKPFALIPSFQVVM